MANVLITYATKTGSTAEAAGIIASHLEKNGIYTTVLPIKDAADIDTFDAVIVGGPINGMTWHPDASSFVSSNAVTLRNRKVSYFCMSYIYKTGGKFWHKQISKAFDASSAIVSPVLTGIFGGVIDKPMPAPARLLFGIKKASAVDQRDNDAVIAWADKWIEENK